MWLAGADLPGRGAVEVVRNPATEEPLAEVPSATSEQVDAAVAAARAALPGWRRTPAGERGELLQGVAAWLRVHTDELGRLMTLEAAGRWSRTPTRSAGPPTPSPTTPSSAATSAGGSSPRSRRGSWRWWSTPAPTWSPSPLGATGQRIGALCAEQVKRTHLELGGKDAFIVCDDVDLEGAAPGAARAAYLNAGQVCTSAERFYVLEPVFEEFVDRLVEETGRLRLGDPLAATTDVGPMVAEVQRAKVERQLDRPGRPAPGCWPAATTADSSAAGSSPPPRWWTSTTQWSCCAPRPSGRSRRCSGSARWTRPSAGPTPCPTGSAPTSTPGGWTTCALHGGAAGRHGAA
jgi:Aldehyde dehydrogenase family